MKTLKQLPAESNERLVVTVPEAAGLLGISRAFAYELVAREELPVVRLGRRLLAPKAQLLALVDPASTEAISDPPLHLVSSDNPF
jgi:excisionase family DNA binding protein